MLLSALLVLASLALPLDGDVDPYRLRELRDYSNAKTSLAVKSGGQRMVVVVMKGTWCQVCVDQLKELAKHDKELKKLNTRIVGLTHESAKKAKAAATKHKIAYWIAADPKHKVIEAMGLWRSAWGHPLPALVVYDRCGKERVRLNGRRPGVRPEKALLKFLRKLDNNPETCDESSA